MKAELASKLLGLISSATPQEQRNKRILRRKNFRNPAMAVFYLYGIPHFGMLPETKAGHFFFNRRKGRSYAYR